VRILNVGNLDLGGDGIRTKRAFDRHASGWTYNAIVRGSKFFDYPADRPWSEAATLARSADVIHARNSFRAARLAGALDKPLVITHHGTRFRNHPADVLVEQRRHGALGLAATLDLWLLAPDELEWLPAPYDLDWLARLRMSNPITQDGPLRIGHAPTNRAVKSTDAFLAACEKLGRETPVEVVLIEGQSWAECLRLKATCHVYFDQALLGYGNNAIEAWGLGCPVVAGATPDTLDEYRRRFGGLPFVHADEGSIYHALASLVDVQARLHWSHRGLDHVNQWHDDLRVVDQLQRVYRRAVER
jgi:hypothetical protein